MREPQGLTKEQVIAAMQKALRELVAASAEITGAHPLDQARLTAAQIQARNAIALVNHLP